MAKKDDLKQRYEAFSRGDLESALDLWAGDFVWDGGRESDLPGSGVHKGKDEAIKVLQESAAGTSSTSAPTSTSRTATPSSYSRTPT